MRTALEQSDSEVYELIQQEETRQHGVIRMIPSENYVSKAVMEATASCLTNKYAEGYPGKRYYEGQQVTDQVETLARERAKHLFQADHVNVQPYSGSIANMAAYSALMQPGETLMGMSLVHGGHLTHGWKVSATSKFFNSAPYPVNSDTSLLDFNIIEDLARKHRPQVIVCGATAYPRTIDFKTFAGIACGSSSNLIERAADVTLKEKRPLVVVPRETPLNLIQLRNLTALAEAGATVLPAMPAFYQKPRSFDDLADFMAGRVLDLLHIEHDLFPRWREGG